MKLRARLATEPEEFSRRILARAFDESGREYIAALQGLVPELSAEDLAWRFHFLLGVMVYTMADPGRIQSMTDGLCDPGDVQKAMRHAVPFLAAGFRAPAHGAQAPEEFLRRKRVDSNVKPEMRQPTRVTRKELDEMAERLKNWGKWGPTTRSGR